MGVERLNSLLPQTEQELSDFFIVSDNITEAMKLATELRNKNYSVEFDYSSRKFTKQLEKAAKTAKNAIILGEDEIKGNYLTIKNLATSEQRKEERINI
jgi:histidyl-tRNA synthetase